MSNKSTLLKDYPYKKKATALAINIYDKINMMYQYKNACNYIVHKCKSTISYHHYFKTKLKLHGCPKIDVFDKYKIEMKLTEKNNKFIKEIINSNNFFKIKESIKYDTIDDYIDHHYFKFNKNVSQANIYFSVMNSVNDEIQQLFTHTSFIDNIPKFIGIDMDIFNVDQDYDPDYYSDSELDSDHNLEPDYVQKYIKECDSDSIDSQTNYDDNDIYNENYSVDDSDVFIDTFDTDNDNESDKCYDHITCECSYNNEVKEYSNIMSSILRNIKKSRTMVTNIYQFDHIENKSNNLLINVNKLVNDYDNLINNIFEKRAVFINQIKKNIKYNNYNNILDKIIKYIEFHSEEDAKRIYEKLSIVIGNIVPFLKNKDIIIKHRDRLTDKFDDFIREDINANKIGFSILLIYPQIYKTLQNQLKTEIDADFNNKRAEKYANKLLKTFKYYNTPNETNIGNNVSKPSKTYKIHKKLKRKNSTQNEQIIKDEKKNGSSDTEFQASQLNSHTIITIPNEYKTDDIISLEEQNIQYEIDNLEKNLIHNKNIYFPILPTIKEIIWSKKIIKNGETFFNYRDNKPYYNRAFWFPDNGLSIYSKEFKCNHCGTTHNLTKDHILSVSCCGNNKVFNLQTLCYDCNENKASYISIEFFHMGRLCRRYIERFKFELNNNYKYSLLNRAFNDPSSCSLTDTDYANTLLFRLLKSLRFEYVKNLHTVLTKLNILDTDVDIQYRYI